RTAGAHRPRAGAADAAGAVPRARPAAATLPRVVIAGVTVGVLTGLFGVGGGFVIVPVLVLVLGIAMRDAVGTSLAVIALSAGTALAARMLGGGDIDWSVAVPFTAAGLAGVVIGTALAARLPARRLARAFAVMLIAVAVVMLLDAAGAG
ncbi:MAG TPA: TSUP family transporter, partial [Euzebyales bacterium]|nr:TSUP family transporter [Euzebyales bacterium]